jgi:hypothetical protein
MQKAGEEASGSLRSKLQKNLIQNYKRSPTMLLAA